MKIILHERPLPTLSTWRDLVNSPLAGSTRNHDVPYDPTAAERCHEALVALRQENIPVAGLALGVRAYWSMISYLESRGAALNLSRERPDPDSMSFMGSDATYMFIEAKLLLDPYAHEDSVRPLCGTEGTRLAFDKR